MSDFSVLIENMPTGLTIEEMQEQIDAYFKKIKEIYPQEEFKIDGIKIQKYNEAKPFYLKESEFNDEELKQIHNNLTETTNKIIEIVVKYK